MWIGTMIWHFDSSLA